MSKVKPRVKVPKTAEVGEIIEIKTLISHPMHSGRAVDGEGNLVPRQIINSFRVSFNSAEIMSVTLRPSISANIEVHITLTILSIMIVTARRARRAWLSPPFLSLAPCAALFFVLT